MDTQADISVIKMSSLHETAIIDGNTVINITGVTDGSVKSLGTIQSELILKTKGNKRPIHIEFHVVPSDFPIPTDGIIGRDFIKNNSCILDFKRNIFTIHNSNETFNIPIENSPCYSQVYTIEPRCEAIRLFSIINKTNSHQSANDQVVDHQEIIPGVFIATCIVNSDSSFLRILNTNPYSVKIEKILHTKTHSLNDFQLLNIISHPSEDRKRELLKTLSDHIPQGAPHSLLNLCQNYSDIFAMPGDAHSVNNFYEQNLNLSDKSPVYIKNYRNPHSQQQEISNQVKDMLHKQIIEPSCSSYNSPIILVPKKTENGIKKYRLCIDFRQLNKKLVPDKFPLPRVDDILDNLGRTRYFSTLDLHAGFWQIPLSKQSKNLTSFSTAEGSFRFNVLPFGLNVAPNSFARMMKIAFSGLDAATAFLYLDDIIVIGTSIEHHLRNLEKVFKVCRDKCLKLNPNKCQFLKPEVTFLGHRCTSEGILPDNTKYHSIENYPIPHDKESTKRFVLLANYWRKFIPNFATIASPLNYLDKKSVKFVWSDKCQIAFETLKNCLINPPILSYPDFNKKFIITVDASKMGIGAVLSQISDDGSDLPISFASKTFTKGERNKATIEQELLAIHFGIKYFRPYIYGVKFLVRSDHKPLQYLFSLKDPTSKLARIRLDLSDYDFTIEHIKGKENVAADALSRLEFNDIRKIRNSEEHQLLVMTRAQLKEQHKIVNTTVGFREALNNITHKNVPILEFGFEDSKLEPECWFYIRSSRILKSKILIYKRSCLRQAIELLIDALSHMMNKNAIKEIKMSQNDAMFNKLDVNDFKNIVNTKLTTGLLWVMQPIIMIESADERKRILNHFHSHPLEGGHIGQKRLYSKIRSKYQWKNMARDVAQLVRNCQLCQVNKPRIKNKEEMIITETPHKPFHTIVIDTIGPFPTTTNRFKYALTAICDFSKYLIICPVPNKEAKTIAKALVDHCLLLHGPVKVFKSDLGTEYANSLMSSLTELLSIEHRTSTAYHHETLGTVERSHRTLNEYLRNYMNDSVSWEKIVRYFAFCYNTTPNSSIHMYTPFEIVYGRIPNELISLKSNFSNVRVENDVHSYVTEIKSNLELAYTRVKECVEHRKLENKKVYDKNSRPLQIDVGDQVLLVNEIRNKKDPYYKLGYTVIDLLDYNNVKIENTQKQQFTVHRDRLRKI